MTKILNNVDIEQISQTIENGKKDKGALRKPVKLQGEWILDSAKGYQFTTELGYEKGKQVLEIDSTSFLGGNGNTLGPMAYCVAGITSMLYRHICKRGCKPGNQVDKAKGKCRVQH